MQEYAWHTDVEPQTHWQGNRIYSHGDMGMIALPKKCSYNKIHNFNALSMSSLLHKQDWKITHGDELLICTENEKGGGINFDMVVPMENGAVYACKFVCLTEVATACTKINTRVSFIRLIVCWDIGMKIPLSRLLENEDGL